MNAQLKRQWLEILRDPKSEKRVGVYGTYPKCCVLGHLQEAWRRWGRDGPFWDRVDIGHLIAEGGGMAEVDAMDAVGELIHFNDHTGKTLLEMADWIEQNVPEGEEDGG